jgi:hypothetical protein
MNNLIKLPPIALLVFAISISFSRNLWCQVECGLNQHASNSPADFYYKYGGTGYQSDNNEIVKIINTSNLQPRTNGYPFHQPLVHLTQNGQNAVVTRERLTGSNDYRGVIVIDEKWLDDYVRATGTSWAKTAALAHELGHIYNEHIYHTDGKDKWHREYSADFFSGYCLYNMGASLCEAQALIQVMCEDYDYEDYSSHPSRQYRLQAIREGFEKACGYSVYGGCGELGDVYIRNYSNFDVTFEIENQRYSLKRHQDLRVAVSGTTPTLYLWECPTNVTCKWTPYTVEKSQGYVIQNKFYKNSDNSLVLKKQ